MTHVVSVFILELDLYADQSWVACAMECASLHFQSSSPEETATIIIIWVMDQFSAPAAVTDSQQWSGMTRQIFTSSSPGIEHKTDKVPKKLNTPPMSLGDIT